MNKTIIVVVITLYKNIKYNKYFKKNKKYYVHDEYNLALKNDYVEFIYFKPISKTKYWYLIKILKLHDSSWK